MWENPNYLPALVGHRRKHKLPSAGEMRELFQLKGEGGRKDKMNDNRIDKGKEILKKEGK
jgi:hypothetical protein